MKRVTELMEIGTRVVEYTLADGRPDPCRLLNTRSTRPRLGACCKSVNCSVKGHSAHRYGPKMRCCAL